MFINSIGDPFFVKNDKSKLVYVNDAFCDLFLLKREDILGKTLAEDVPQNERESFLSIDRQVIETGIENINEETLTVSGQKTKVISTRKSRFTDNDGNRLLIGVIRDITKRVEVEKELRYREVQFRGLFAQSHIPMVMIGINNLITGCNAAFCNFLNFSEHELVDHEISEFAHPDDKNSIIDAFGKLLTNEIDSVLFKGKYLNRNGKILWGEHMGSAVKDSDGDVLYYSFIIQDITERQRNEDDLKESEKLLFNLNQTKDKLFSIIGHDLRSPFANIIGLSDILIDSTPNENKNDNLKFLGVINSSAKSSLNLLDNLLNWAKSQTGQLKINQQDVLLNPLLDEVVKQSSAAAHLKKTSIVVNSRQKLSAYTDQNMLKLVIRNLISNALKFTNENGTILLELKSDGLYTLITVADNGVGMNEETRKSLFNNGAKVSTLGTAKEKGSGLGLLLCKEFIEKLGGKIWVESKFNEGSKFHFTLPKRDDYWKKK